MKRPCLTPGCRSLTEKGSRCAEHTRAKQRARDVVRGTSTARGYDGTYRANRAIVLARGEPCAYCGAPATTADHRLALRDGGDSSLDNLVASCASCNYSRGARLGNARRKASGSS